MKSDIKIRLKVSYVLEGMWPVTGFPNAADKRVHRLFPLAIPLQGKGKGHSSKVSRGRG